MILSMSIYPGVNFEQRVDMTLDWCPVALVLIDEQWLTVRNQKRLDRQKDYVVAEVAAALRRTDVTVIPIVIEDAVMPQEPELPTELCALAKTQSFKLGDEDWPSQAEKLCNRIAELESDVSPPPKAQLLARYDEELVMIEGRYDYGVIGYEERHDAIKTLRHAKELATIEAQYDPGEVT